MKTKFWEFKGLANKKGELFLYGEISDTSWWGDEISPAQFQKDLAALGDIDSLDVFINSPGGDVFAGITIYNVLKRHAAYKTVHVDGLAASSASIVAMAGDKIVMPASATLMIHNAWCGGWGNKAKMRALADELERLDGQLAGIYSTRTGKDPATVAAWMDKERWMNGDEALADGFADEIEEGKAIAACAGTDKYFAWYQHPPRAESETPQAAEQGGFSISDAGGTGIYQMQDVFGRLSEVVVNIPAADDTKTYLGVASPDHNHNIPQHTHGAGIVLAQITADNGAETPQPVADKTPEKAKDTLVEQRRRFTATKRKLLEV